MKRKTAKIRHSGLYQTKYEYVNDGKYIKIPVFSCKIPAGHPQDTDDHQDGHIFVHSDDVKNPEATFAMTVSGNSMYPLIFDKEQIVIDTEIPKKSVIEDFRGCIIVALLNGEYTLKRLQIINECVYLVPENPDFERIKIKPEDDFRVTGVVLHSIKNHYHRKLY